MKKTIIVISLTGCFACQSTIQAPVAKVIPYEFHEFGNTRIDNYHWMRLSDEQKNADDPDTQTQDVLDYLHAENNYLKSGMKHTKKLQDQLFEELKSRIKQDDESVPYVENGYFYWTKYEVGKEYPCYYRKADKPDAADSIMLDVNNIAKNKTYCSVSGVSVSPDNKLLAYATDFVSRRRYTIHFMDLTTGAHLNDSIVNTTGSIVWANDNKTVFYITKDEQTLRSNRLFRHRIGTDIENDQLCYDETDETFSIGVGKTQSNKYILLSSTQTLTSEVRILDANKPDNAFSLFTPRSVNHLYHVDHINDAFYIYSNREAINFKLMTCDEKNTEEKNWKEIVPHRTDYLLENFELFNNYLAINERKDGLNKLRIISLKDGSEQYIPFEEDVYTAGFHVNAEPALKTLRFSYSSLTTPYSVYEYNMETQEVGLIKETEILGGFDKNNYETKRLWATAADGTKIPISMVYRKGFQQDGKGKLLLYAYGSYGNSTNPSFNSSILSLLDRGFAYAIAHIRGGSELGRAWYENGKLLKKKNTFTDFNDCARFLIAEQYTSPSSLFAYGASAGGLLMGAIINMEPELYKGVIAGVPFVDIVTTMLDASIPLTTFEWDEWGNPAEKEYYDYMLSYAPYDQVKAQNYPNLLVTTGFWDSQVQYWEPAKWVAKLRALKTDNNRLYMDCNMNVGHGGASGRFERLKSTALQYAFLLTL